MTNYRVENSRRDFLLAIAGGIAGLVAASSPGPVFAQTASGPTLSMSTIGAGREGGALGALFVKAGHTRDVFVPPSRYTEGAHRRTRSVGPRRNGCGGRGIWRRRDDGRSVYGVGADRQRLRHALAKKVLVIDVSNPIARRDGAAIVEWVDEQGGAGLATAKLLPGAHIARAFNAINYAKLSADAHRQGELVGVPIAGDDPHAIGIASTLIRQIGFDPVVIGGLAMGKYLVPGTPLGGEHTAGEIRQIVTNLH